MMAHSRERANQTEQLKRRLWIRSLEQIEKELSIGVSIANSEATFITPLWIPTEPIQWSLMNCRPRVGLIDGKGCAIGKARFTNHVNQ
jgi:hypothetical protein